MKKKFSQSQVGLKFGFKSGLERFVANQLESTGLPPNYEARKIKYTKPSQEHTYTPDFPVCKNLIIETKGRFLPQDRQKMLLIKKQCPDIEFRFIFSNSKARISKKSNTTYAAWCLKNGFKFADKKVPKEWIDELLTLTKQEKV